MEKTVSRRAVAVPPSPSGQDAEPRERRPHRPWLEEGGGQRLPGLREDLGHVLRLDGDVGRVAVVVGVSRPEQEQPVPRDGERDADVVLRDGQRRAPVASARDEHVHALAEPHRGAGTRILESADGVDPRPGGVHHDARAARRRRRRRAATSAPRDPPVHEPESDDLGAVDDRGTRLLPRRGRSRGRVVRRSSRRRRTARTSAGRRGGATAPARSARSGRTSQLRRDRARVE